MLTLTNTDALKAKLFTKKNQIKILKKKQIK